MPSGQFQPIKNMRLFLVSKLSVYKCELINHNTDEKDKDKKPLVLASAEKPCTGCRRSALRRFALRD
jgi:hypothetical protein